MLSATSKGGGVGWGGAEGSPPTTQANQTVDYSVPSKCFEIFLQDVCSIIFVFFLPYPSIQLIPVACENT